MADEFAELNATEDEFDRAMATGDAVEVDVPKPHGLNEQLDIPGAPALTETYPSGILRAWLLEV